MALSRRILEDIYMLAGNLKRARKLRGLTAQQVATHIGTSLRNYRKYESDDAKPTYEALVMIADFLNVSTDYLLGRVKISD
jgi:transcriptional regulator with XRE-family HTH domain